ncbi:PREDICTED: solute carrier family 15 member 2-like [Acropora digitifera]|uniref:solute carrier family 15 member 2-like n=1 Tax=Acropora digitifera TaxID=70779 RepID=UPI00077A8E9A|nr:PREDICTED: solute carrier family 15 member 2-like [Acropora digitifera]
MGIASGNIKPCLAAFGGDQFRKEQENILELFFAMFYASVNVGAVLCMWFVPMIRTDVQCFGRDCYPVVFAVNALLIIISTLSLVVGKRIYTLKDPDGNVTARVFKIIGHALRNKFRHVRPPHLHHCSHWLDYASDQYEGGYTLRSDQIQALNPILVLILIPLYDGVIYPIFERCQMPLSSLKKMTGGLILAALAFVICALVQIQIQTIGEAPETPSTGQTTLEFINSAPCPVSIDPKSFFRVNLNYGEHAVFYQI